MGEAKRRGSFEVRKSEAIEAGRSPEITRERNRSRRQARLSYRQAYLEYLITFRQNSPMLRSD